MMAAQQSVYRSFKVAFTGIYTFFSSDRNGQIQLVAAGAALVAGYLLEISRVEWMFLLFSIAIVFIAEMINSAIEKLCNLVTMEYHPLIRFIKDVSAGAVLVACLFSISVGVIIFFF